MSDRTSARRAVRETTSFRLPAETVARLDARASLLGSTRTTIAERLLEEGLRLVEHPGIVFTDGAQGERRATLAGSRLDVWMVVETIRANAGSTEAAARYHDVPRAWIETATRYFAAFPDEIDAEIGRNRAFTEREMRLASEQRRLLG